MEESHPLKSRCNFSMAVSHCFPFFFSFNQALILKMHHLKQSNSQKKFFFAIPSFRKVCTQTENVQVSQAAEPYPRGQKPMAAYVI